MKERSKPTFEEMCDFIIEWTNKTVDSLGEKNGKVEKGKCKGNKRENA